MAESLFDLSSILPITQPSQPSDRYSTLIYGRMRVGKSYLASTAAEVEGMFPIAWIACEDGTASFSDTENIDVFRPETAKDVVTLVDALIDNETKYKTVVVDTLGALQEMVKRDYVAKNKAMDFEGWALVSSVPTDIVNNLHYHSPYKSIFIAHTEKMKDDTVGSVMSMPYFLGNKALKDIPPIIDNIFYLAKVEDGSESARVLQTTGSSRIDAGSRFEQKLPAQLVNTNFQEIHDYITGKKVADTE